MGTVIGVGEEVVNTLLTLQFIHRPMTCHEQRTNTGAFVSEDSEGDGVWSTEMLLPSSCSSN